MFLESLAATHFILAAAQPSWCRPHGPAYINVRLEYDPILTNFTQSVEQLKTFQIDTINPYGNNVNTIVGGLTQGMIQVEQSMQTGGLRYGRQSCVWATKVDVILHLKPTVYVARNFPPGTCQHNAILVHEQKHIKVDQDLALLYKPVFEDTLQRAINAYRVVGPIPVGQEDKVQSDMAAYLKQTIANVTYAFEKDRNVRQQAVDTRQEYDSVAAKCNAARR